MTPDALTLVERVRALGIAIRADGDTLVLAPRGVVPPDLRAELVAAKPAVLAVLRATSAAPVAPTPALRTAYHRWFALTVGEADGTPVDPDEAEDFAYGSARRLGACRSRASPGRPSARRSATWCGRATCVPPTSPWRGPRCAKP